MRDVLMDRVAPATHLVRAGRLAARFFVIASLRSDPVDVWSFSPLLANPIARPSPLFSWIASLSLAMTVMIEYLFVPMPSTILPVRLWSWRARFACDSL